VLDTAFALGAPSIRVWAGNVDSAVATDEYVKRVAADASRIAELSARAGITVGFEYHGGTISDNADAALKLLERADHSNLYSLWQPSVGASPAERALSLSRLLPWLSHVHVFQWHIHERLPLSEGGSEWPAYVQILKERIQPTPMLIEFVAGEDPEQFLRDAQILKQWIDQAST
jgi:sugar phosphate isomerase/epimerase